METETTTNEVGEILVNGDGVIELHSQARSIRSTIFERNTLYLGRNEAVQLVSALVAMLADMDPSKTERTVRA